MPNGWPPWLFWLRAVFYLICCDFIKAPWRTRELVPAGPLPYRPHILGNAFRHYII